jgi:hypothetical protein
VHTTSGGHLLKSSNCDSLVGIRSVKPSNFRPLWWYVRLDQVHSESKSLQPSKVSSLHTCRMLSKVMFQKYGIRILLYCAMHNFASLAPQTQEPTDCSDSRFENLVEDLRFPLFEQVCTVVGYARGSCPSDHSHLLWIVFEFELFKYASQNRLLTPLNCCSVEVRIKHTASMRQITVGPRNG